MGNRGRFVAGRLGRRYEEPLRMSTNNASTHLGNMAPSWESNRGAGGRRKVYRDLPDVVGRSKSIRLPTPSRESILELPRSGPTMSDEGATSSCPSSHHISTWPIARAYIGIAFLSRRIGHTPGNSTNGFPNSRERDRWAYIIASWGNSRLV